MINPSYNYTLLLKALGLFLGERTVAVGLLQFSVKSFNHSTGEEESPHTLRVMRERSKNVPQLFMNILNEGRNSDTIMTFLGINFKCKLEVVQI